MLVLRCKFCKTTVCTYLVVLVTVPRFFPNSVIAADEISLNFVACGFFEKRYENVDFAFISIDSRCIRANAES